MRCGVFGIVRTNRRRFMRVLEVIAAVAFAIFLCFFVLSTINHQKAEYAKQLGTFDSVSYGTLASSAAKYRYVAYAFLIVAFVSLAGAWAVSRRKTCPRCGYKIKKNAEVCNFCGYLFPKSPAKTESAERQFVSCSGCGKQFYAKVSKCPFCGYRRRSSLFFPRKTPK